MKLSDKDFGRIQSFYQQSFNQFGHNDPRSVRWGNRNDQVRRFDILCQVADLSHRSILDVGCGLGDLYKYLLQHQIEVDYTGIDIVREFIHGAQQRFPQGNFIEQDIFEVDRQYDYILASGALSFKVKNNAEYYQDMIRRMFSLAKRGVAFNMLDKRIHSDDETYAAYDPQAIADFCQTITPQVHIVTDYLPQDFAVYLYK